MLMYVKNSIKHSVINGSLSNQFLHFGLFNYRSSNMNITKWISDIQTN